MGLSEEMATQVIANALNMARNMKDDIVKEDGATDVGICPTIIVGYGDEMEDGGGICEIGIEGVHPVDVLPNALSAMYSQGILKKWSWMCLIVEGYVGNASDEKDLEKYERGSAEEDYKTNPLSKVQEALLATVFCFDESIFGGVQAFTLNDIGNPNYLDIEFHEKGKMDDGNIPFIFKSFIKFCKLREKEEQAKNN